jgi:hypothetical protein
VFRYADDVNLLGDNTDTIKGNRRKATAAYKEAGLEVNVQKIKHARFEVFTAVTMKNGVFWDVTPCGSC